MVKVSNQKCIRMLADRSLKAAKVRNLIAVLAIALTTLLFTALFTIALTLNNSLQESTFRQVGGDFMGSFKNVTEEQMEALSDDPLITRWGRRLMLGMPTEQPFNKAHVEVSYMDEICAEGSFCVPEKGALPRENTDEIACDTRILQLLGVEPEIGAKITMPYELGTLGEGAVRVEDTFTLSGWWAYDPAGMASQAVVPRSYAESVLKGYERQGANDLTGTWTMNVYFKDSLNIESDMEQVLKNHGYQTETPYQKDFIQIGVNWGYTSAQVASKIDPGVLVAMVMLVLVILLTGYLIIYNIFQISVTGDIRYYGLLKTIGTTGRQIKRIIRRQAYSLCLVGIPVGLIGGWVVGTLLAPVAMQIMSYSVTHPTANPLIFLLSAAFSLLTVRISCARPGRMAARVSPIEAIRYTEGGLQRKREKKSVNGGKIGRMALANLGRNKTKTVVTILSLSLSVVLLNGAYTFSQGFDMDKYLRNWVVTDFIVGHADYFQTGAGFSGQEQALTEEIISDINAQGGITESGRIYGMVDGVQEHVTEDWYRAANSAWYPPEVLDQLVAEGERTQEGGLLDRVNLYGMEKLPLDELHVIEGDLAPLYDMEQNAIAAVYRTDDYDEVEWDTQWATVGDKVTLRYVDAWEFYDVRTGEATQDPDQIELGFVGRRSASYREVTYTVAAVVTMRHSMSFRYSGADQFLLNADVLKQDSGGANIMTYLFNTTPEAEASMESFLKDYTGQVSPLYDYESKGSYLKEFEGMRGMFLTLGSVLSLIIGVVGVLNFLNAVLTSILTRRREFAILQSIGMTGRQLKTMLVGEGLCYAGFSLLLSLVLSLLVGWLIQSAVGPVLWFFTYRFTLMPFALMAPIFLLMGILLPLLAYRPLARQPIVERLRQEE